MAHPFVIFDFDGTVADSFRESLLAYNRVAPRLHLRQVDLAEVPELRRMGTGALLRKLGVPMLRLPRLMVAVRDELHNHFHTVGPVPGICEAIAEIASAGSELAIVTSNSEDNVRGFLSRHDIRGFGSIVASASAFGKARRLRHLMKATGHPCQSTAYIGDTPPDIRAARESGALAIGVTWGFSDAAALNDERPDSLLESASQLPATVERLLRDR